MLKVNPAATITIRRSKPIRGRKQAPKTDERDLFTFSF
jgi:hypothetical protein